MIVFLGNHQGRDPGGVGTLHPKPQRLCTPALLEPVKPEFGLVGSPSTGAQGQMGIVLNYCQYGVLYFASYYSMGPYINFPHFGKSNLGKLSNVGRVVGLLVCGGTLSNQE